MPRLNVASFKFNWKGTWTSGQKYKKNDLCQWNGSTYVCLMDMEDEYEIAMDLGVSTNNYRANHPEFYYVDKRPDNLAYWKLVLRGNTFKRGWAPHRTYQIGDVVRYGGDLYMYTGQCGYGASATANISNGQVVSITVNNGGYYYIEPPTIVLASQGITGFYGTGAQAYANVGTSTISVTAGTRTNPVRLTLATTTGLANGQLVGFRDVPGMTQLNGNSYFIKVINSTQVDLYTDANQVSSLDGTNFSSYYTGATGLLIRSDAVTSIVVTSGGSGYNIAPTVIINPPLVRNTWVEDPRYWTKVFENPNPDTRRMYAVATANMQPLGWTRNYGDFPNPQTHEGNQVSMIDALGVPYTIGGSGDVNNYNTGGRGVRGDYVTTWQPGAFSFVDWLRSTDNVTRLQLTGVLNTVGLPTPDGQCPKCVQWLKSRYSSWWLFNNGEVYFSGFSNTGQSGDSSNATKGYPIRVYSASTTGYLGETLPRSFNQTKIIKIDIPNTGQSSSSTCSVYALGNDGSLWVWGYNGYGQLGLGQQTPGTINGSTVGGYARDQFVPQRIPAQFFDYKRIVDIVSFGNEVTSVFAIDEDGDLWGWGADYYGELGLGGSGARDNRRPIPTRIPFDFKRYGGIKKISYYHHSTTNVRASFILTNDGSLFAAGYFRGGTAPTILNRNNSGTYNRFTRYHNSSPNCKAIENFWVVGDQAYNVYLRERDTGLTYAFGDNWQQTLGSQQNNNYWWNSGDLSSGFSLVKGPRNLVHVTNNSSEAATNASGSALTIVLLEESGRAWGQGLNTRGSLSLGYAGASNATPMQNPETGGTPIFQPILLPSARLTTMMGYGTSGSGTAEDLCVYITDDGQALYCGTDGTVRNGSSNVQGAQGLRWYNNNIGNPGPFDRLTMHSQLSD